VCGDVCVRESGRERECVCFRDYFCMMPLPSEKGLGA